MALVVLGSTLEVALVVLGSTLEVALVVLGSTLEVALLRTSGKSLAVTITTVTVKLSTQDS